MSDIDYTNVDPQELLKQVHNKGKSGQKPNVSLPQSKPAITKEPVIEKETPVVKQEAPVQPVYKKVEPPVLPYIPNPGLSEKAQPVARHDVDPSLYSQEPIQVHMKIFNKEIRDFIQDFKKNNQHVGGKPFNQTIATEIMLEVLYYDIGIRPFNENTGRGFQSPQEFRAYLQEKLQKSE